MLARLRPLLVSALVLVLGSCSEAETPDARFDGGVPVEPQFDAGPGIGSRDEPCATGNRCEESNLVCVREDGEGENDRFCRLKCDRAATDDPCGERSTCERLETNEGACLPAGQQDEDCPCDEGFACALLANDDGGQTAICKRTCALDDGDGGITDAGNPAPCPGNDVCRPLQNSDFGVCVAD